MSKTPSSPVDAESLEHDACGIGFIAGLDGRRQHQILAMGLEALTRLDHRGARGTDSETSDGCGLLTHIPHAMLSDELGLDLDEGNAVGMFFLPTAAAENEAARGLIGEVLEHDTFSLLAWRDVPCVPEVLGPEGREACPAIVQVVLAGPDNLPNDDRDALERRLYLARRRIERRALELAIDLVAVSLSCYTVVYKSMSLAPRLGDFYPDLRDARFTTGIALFHQRFSTNTRSTWSRAQPFRLLAHNGEINTIQGNANWMRSRENELANDVWGDTLQDLLPVLDERGSDSSMLDNVLELLLRSGRGPCHALAMLVPAASRDSSEKDRDLLAFYEYHAHLLEPWDGPAALVMSDGKRAVATLDRNGLRPLRYWLTDEFLVVGSETGIVDVPQASIRQRGRLGPGQLLYVDLETGRFENNAEIKHDLANRRPWQSWLDTQQIHPPAFSSAATAELTAAELHQSHLTYGYSKETIQRILHPMMDGEIPIASMGNDTPSAVLSQQPQIITSYFKQRFAQVTNPPVDPLRERLAFDLHTVVGGWANLLAESPKAARLIRFSSPVIDRPQLDWLRTLEPEGFSSTTLDTLFPATDPQALRPALGELCKAAERAVDNGVQLIVLSDRQVDAEHAPIPMLLAVSAVHHHLVRAQKRKRISLICETAEPREDHHVACLIAYGATLVYPFLVEETVLREAVERDIEPEVALRGYRGVLEKGLLKILARLGVCPMASYHGAQLFEIVGLDRDVVEQFFTGTPSRISGVGLQVLASDVLRMHTDAFGEAAHKNLADRGLFRFRKGGEVHDYRPKVFKNLHKAVRQSDPEAFRTYSEEVDKGTPTQLRDLFAWRRAEQPLPLDQVEPASDIAQRFCSAAMSHGAISREAHEALAVAMNRLGGRSNSGEGGEAAERFLPYKEGETPHFDGAWHPQPGDWGNSAIKQVASGRFGVTTYYLRSARELEIKMAQGSKPGEGGQIPGHKVTEEIAHLRRSTPGVMLISPPPHHDIYSIEDLAQLIHDLKRVHPQARVGVKLVSQAGIGAVAAGVVKAHADYVMISGEDGGTGASPLSSIKHAGMPWELGLAEAQRELMRSGLRERVTLRVDGGLKTGSDVLKGALLGAEEFAFGTAPLVALGCVMARQCHLNTCPVGVATQRQELRQRFPGLPEHVVAYFLFVAEQVRHGLAEIALPHLDDVVGRFDLVESREDRAPLLGLDLERLLSEPASHVSRRRTWPRNDPPEEHKGLDERLYEDAGEVLKGGTVSLSYPVRNCDRSLGARLSGDIAAATQGVGLKPGSVTVDLHGSAGQSFGAFAVAGIDLKLIGDAQDYVGKGLSGGRISVRLPPGSAIGDVAAGNVLLYGATAGELYVAGRVGERFCVRNSGALAVVEGCGDHGCEYMTGGIAVVLGEVGRNFGAGMNGGVAYVAASEALLAERIAADQVAVTKLDEEDFDVLGRILQRHIELTQSALATELFSDWPRSTRFCRVGPLGDGMQRPVASLLDGTAATSGLLP